MISALIIVLSVLLAVAFGVAWIALPGFRGKIEDPKFEFQERLGAYNRQMHLPENSREGRTDERG